MSILEQLPYEISIEILSYLPVSDLVNTSILSSHMRALSEPLLYKAPVITDNDDDGPLTTIGILLRTVLSPGGGRLATLVHSLHVTCCFASMRYTDSDYNFGEDDENVDPESALEGESDRAIRAAAAAALGIDSFRDTPEEHVKILLHHIPHLNALNIVAEVIGADLSCDVLNNHNLDWLMENLPHTIPLRQFRSSVGGVNLDTLLSLLSFPSLRRIDCCLLDNRTINVDTLDVAPATSLVTHLRFSETTVSQECLEFILKIPAALAFFSYRSSGSHHNLDPSHVLQPLRMSLKYIHLGYVPVTKPIGSFRDWPLLRTVSCSLTALLGKNGQNDMPRLNDMLPAGLRQLEICRNHYWSVAAEIREVVDLLKQKEAKVPGLETLVVFSSGMRTTDVWNQSSLRIACHEAGVQLSPAVVTRRLFDPRFHEMARMSAPIGNRRR